MSILKTILRRGYNPLVKDLSLVPQRTLYQLFLYSPKKGLDRDWLAKIQQPLDFTVEGMRKYLERKEWAALKDDQKFVADRHEILGPDLATSHFIVMRGGAVKFVNSNRWIEKDKDGKFHLPDRMAPNYILEAVDASNMNMMFETFDNFIKLKQLQYLNLSKCPYIDDWCIDRLQQFKSSLICLDVSGCPNVTERGLASLHKIPTLRCLRAHDMPNIEQQPLLKLMLEEMMPLCTVEGLDREDKPAETDHANLNRVPSN